jgi:hypothetical protein
VAEAGLPLLLRFRPPPAPDSSFLQRSSVSLRTAPRRLELARIRSIAASYAADRSRWEPLLEYAEDKHWSVRLHSDADHDVWLISWLQSQSTTLHDHGGSSGAFEVVSGQLHEYEPGGGERALVAGRLRSFGPRYVHDVYNPYPTPAVSVHVYSPPLTVMSYYDEAPGGGVELLRTEITTVPETPERGLQDFHSLSS